MSEDAGLFKMSFVILCISIIIIFFFINSNSCVYEKNSNKKFIELKMGAWMELNPFPVWKEIFPVLQDMDLFKESELCENK